MTDSLETRRHRFLEILDIGDEAQTRFNVDLSENTWRQEARKLTRKVQIEQLQRDYLVFWNESVGAMVEFFWTEIERRQVEVVRKKDVVAHILKRGKILRPDHFFAIEEAFEELQTCGKVSAVEAEALNEILDAYEAEGGLHRPCLVEST